MKVYIVRTEDIFKPGFDRLVHFLRIGIIWAEVLLKSRRKTGLFR